MKYQLTKNMALFAKEMGFLSVKDLNSKIFGRFTIVLTIFFIIGCASEPVKVELPAHHPANPGAQEAEFIPPPNPFREDVRAMQMESTTDSMMKHKTHDENGQKQMHHDMGTKDPGHGQDDHQHEEHSQ
jgi:hypothetical protein